MKLCVALVVLAAVSAMAVVPRTLEDDTRLFADFKQTYGRVYLPSEEVHKFECFRKNLNIIDQRNARGAEQHGVNQYTDLCADEFAKMYLGVRPQNDTRKASAAAIYTPAEVKGACTGIDWRTKGAVTPIKNQGQCGSCWAFSATSNMEGQWFLAGNSLVSLSEEELVQCSSADGNAGCNGGMMDYAFQWTISNGGIDSEADYPYTSGSGYTGNCNAEKAKKHVATFKSYQDLPSDEQQMAAWVCQHGPLSSSVDATTWQTYQSGIMTSCPSAELDHGTLIVGFDASYSPPYWILKNMWGTSWGENGYVRIEMWTNQCGIKGTPCSALV